MKWNISKPFGIFLIGFGILFNIWILERIFSPDSVIENILLKCGIVLIQIALIVIGVFFIRKNPFISFGYAVYLFVSVSFLLIISLSLLFSIKYYKYSITEKRRRWKVVAHQPDSQLGYAPIPGVCSARLFPIGNEEIPTCYDNYGFRVPISDSSRQKPFTRPLILTLGGSFTFGDACYAEETYSYLLGNLLKGTSLNAGVCGYGLHQMLVRAKRIIPEFRPDIVVVLYAPWLVSRSIRGFSPLNIFAPHPAPYFVKSNEGIVLHPMPYPKYGGSWPSKNFKGSDPNPKDFLVFYFHRGLPVWLHYRFHSALYKTKIKLGLDQGPTKDRIAVIQHVYKSIKSICDENNASFIVVGLNLGYYHRKKQYASEMKVLSDNMDFVVIDAEKDLVGNLEENTLDAYKKAYSHWRGTPPVEVDAHPNPHAHKIIAEAIYKVILERNIVPKFQPE